MCEVGWAETIEELHDDARLWLLHTDGETRIIINYSFIETNTRHARETEYISNEGGKGRKWAARGILIEILVIDTSINYDQLVLRLHNLNEQSRLEKHLVEN